MYLTVHALTGAAIGSYLGSPVAAFALGAVSHFMLDAVPHSDPEVVDKETIKAGVPKAIVRRMYKIAAIDITLVLIVVTIALNLVGPGQTNSLMLGAIGGVVPDGILGLSMIYGAKRKILKRYVDFHAWCHFPHERIKLRYGMGILTQVVTLGLAYTFLAA